MACQQKGEKGQRGVEFETKLKCDRTNKTRVCQYTERCVQLYCSM